METSQLKYSIIDKLISIRDVALLEKIDHLMGIVDITKPVFKVSANQQSMLQRSEQDILHGHVTSDDEVNAEEDEWLKG